MKSRLLIFFLFLSIFNIYASDVKFYNINAMYGISMREMASVCKDGNGFIWASSKTGILRITESDYRILVGELDDEQMAALSRLGNDYRPTSAYERGLRYTSRLQNEFAGNISALADAENISRKIITRCINTAKLPKSVVALFAHPGELSARSGEALQKAFADKEELLKQQAETLHDQKKAGLIFEAEEVISLLTSVLKQSRASRVNLSSRHQFAPGATALYKGDKMVLNLDRSRIPAECIEKIEAILKELEKPGV